MIPWNVDGCLGFGANVDGCLGFGAELICLCVCVVATLMWSQNMSCVMKMSGVQNIWEEFCSSVLLIKSTVEKWNDSDSHKGLRVQINLLRKRLCHSKACAQVPVNHSCICSSKYKIFIIKSLAHTYTHTYLGPKRSHYNDNTWELWWNEVDRQQKCVVWISKMPVFSCAGFLGPDGSGTVAALLIWTSYTNVWVRLWFADSRIRCWLNYHPKYVSEFPSTFPKMPPRYAKQVSHTSEYKNMLP